MLLTDLQPRVKSLLEIARLGSIFVICKDEAEAIAQVASSMDERRPIFRPVTALGHAAIGTLEFIGGVGYLVLDTLGSAKQGLISGRGRRLGWTNLWAQMVRVGVRSVPIVMLVLFCIGAILSLQMAPILKSYGALDRVADIISIAVFRELGPLVAAVVLTGYAGASIAAELGTMVVSEEIEAPRSPGHQPDPIPGAAANGRHHHHDGLRGRGGESDRRGRRAVRRIGAAGHLPRAIPHPHVRSDQGRRLHPQA